MEPICLIVLKYIFYTIGIINGMITLWRSYNREHNTK